jgi:hypothetical protein
MYVQQIPILWRQKRFSDRRGRDPKACIRLRGPDLHRIDPDQQRYTRSSP